MGREYMGIFRITYIIQKGEIKQVYDKVKTKSHAEDILNNL
jgi:peroxiredoxin